MSIIFKHTSDDGRDICEKGPLVNWSLLLLICGQQYFITRDDIMDSTTTFWSPDLERLWSTLTLKQWHILVKDTTRMTAKAARLGEIVDQAKEEGDVRESVWAEIVFEVDTIYRDFHSLNQLRCRYLDSQGLGEKALADEVPNIIRRATSASLPRPLSQEELDHIDRVVLTRTTTISQLPTPDITPPSSKPRHVSLGVAQRRLQPKAFAEETKQLQAQIYDEGGEGAIKLKFA